MGVKSKDGNRFVYIHTQATGALQLRKIKICLGLGCSSWWSPSLACARPHFNPQHQKRSPSPGVKDARVLAGRPGAACNFGSIPRAHTPQQLGGSGRGTGSQSSDPRQSKPLPWQGKQGLSHTLSPAQRFSKRHLPNRVTRSSEPRKQKEQVRQDTTPTVPAFPQFLQSAQV